MIEQVHIEGFKSLRDVTLDGMQPLTVLVGPNGVGKSSVLQAIERLCQFRAPAYPQKLDEPAATIFGGRWHPGRVMTRRHASFTIELRSTDIACSVSAVTAADTHGGYRYWLDAGGHTCILPPALPGSDTRPDFFRESGIAGLPTVAIFKLDAAALGAPSIAGMEPALDTRGAGLATLLAYIAGADRDRLDVIESHLRDVIGVTGRIRILPTQLEIEEREYLRIGDDTVPRTTRRKTPAHRFEIDIDDAGPVPADLLSEGTLTTLALLTVLNQPDGPRLLLLDDIDQGLHPAAQFKLVEALRAILAERPDVQIICTSHSPDLLDVFQPEEVQVMTLGPGSAVSAARLDHHPEWPKWRGMLQTGEFWQSVGESWVVDAAREAALRSDG